MGGRAAGERAGERAVERADERAGERADERAGERAGEGADERAIQISNTRNKKNHRAVVHASTPVRRETILLRRPLMAAQFSASELKGCCQPNTPTCVGKKRRQRR